MEINYDKNIKRKNCAKKIKKQPVWSVFVAAAASKIVLMGKKYKIEKINIKGLKPPYLLLCNHMYFEDFAITSLATFPKRVNSIVSLDGYVGKFGLLDIIGSIPKRKFTGDTTLYRHISHVLKDHKNIVCIYPEARYTPIGTTAILPDSLAKMCKLLGVPVVVLKYRGNHIHRPFWDYNKKRKVPLHATMTQIVTQEQIKTMSVQEIDKVIKEAFVYDEYKYLLDNNYHITEPYRAEGLHKVLYQCPVCLKEHVMDTKGDKLFCTSCNAEWVYQTNGKLVNTTQNNVSTTLEHVPSWYEWQRENVKQQILNDSYSFSDQVQVYSLPNSKRFIHLGAGTITHNYKQGFTATFSYNGQEYVLTKNPLENYSLHVEYDCIYLNKKDLFSLSTHNDSFFFEPTKQNVITKLSIATEEMYKLQKETIKTK